MSDVFVGIDVSKGRLDVAVRQDGSKRGFHVANSEGGVKGLVKQLHKLAPERVVMEASGGYERLAWRALDEAAMPISVMNPVRTKSFAISLGRKEKTDQVDAEVLAEFGEKMKPNSTPAPDQQTEELRALISRRSQLAHMRAAEKSRLHQLPATQGVLAEAHIGFIDQQVSELEKAIRQAIKARPEWLERDRLLQSIKGVGPVFSAMVIAFLPEAGQIPHKKLASLVGVAPYARDSGSRHGKRCIWGGRDEVRHVLYMATLAAIRSNPAIREFYERLIERKKLFKVAMVACMNKLLRVVNAVLQRGLPWNPDWRKQLQSSGHKTHDDTTFSVIENRRSRGVDKLKGLTDNGKSTSSPPFHLSTPAVSTTST